MLDAARAMISMQSTSLLYLLGSSMQKMLLSISFPPPSPFLLSNGEPKCLLESNVMTVNGRPLKNMLSLVLVVRNPEYTLGSSKRDCQVLKVTSWR